MVKSAENTKSEEMGSFLVVVDEKISLPEKKRNADNDDLIKMKTFMLEYLYNIIFQQDKSSIVYLPYLIK